MVVMKVRVTPDSGNDPTVMKNRVTTDGDNDPTVIAKGMCWCIVNQDGIFIVYNIISATSHKHVSDSSLIQKYSKELVHALSISEPARQSLAIGLHSKNVISHLEKHGIMNDPGSAMSLADKLVGYIQLRIDSQEHCDNIWEELHSEEAALKDILKKIESEKGKRSSLLITIHWRKVLYMFPIQGTFSLFRTLWNMTISIIGTLSGVSIA